MIEWLAMDGYAGFVWAAWGLTVLVTGGVIYAALTRRAAAAERLARLEAEISKGEAGR